LIISFSIYRDFVWDLQGVGGWAGRDRRAAVADVCDVEGSVVSQVGEEVWTFSEMFTFLLYRMNKRKYKTNCKNQDLRT